MKYMRIIFVYILSIGVEAMVRGTVLFALLIFAAHLSNPAAAQTSSLSRASMSSSGYQANFSTVLDGVSTGAKFVFFAASKPMGDMLEKQGSIAEIDFGFEVPVTSVAGFKPGRQYKPRTPFDVILAATTLRTSVNSKSMAKFGKAYESAAARYFLPPVCPTPLPPCCFPPCPCPCPRPCQEPLPFGDLGGKYVPSWWHAPMMKTLGAKVLPHDVKLTLNAKNLGPVADYAMRNLAAQYEGFRNEYSASGSGKLEQRPQMKGLTGAWDRFPD